MPAAPDAALIHPLRDPRFRRLFAAQVVALLGTGLSTVALTLLAYDLAGGDAAAVLGTALAIKMVAYVVFAPVAGGLAHRLARRPFLIAMDLVRAGAVLAMPFASRVWQIYLLIFLLNLFAAGFKPVFAATFPDVLPDERAYTRALSLSRVAYDLESLLSPALAALALLVTSYSGLFAANAVAFLASAALIASTALPASRAPARPGGVFHEIRFGTLGYLRTPRLRALLTLYLGVAAASAMVIVNTVVYVRSELGLTSSRVATALAASGAGSLGAALLLPKLLDKISDRPVMLLGGALMALGVGLAGTRPDFPALLVLWLVIGAGWSLVQAPAGRVVNRSSAPADRPAYFSAQFALTHACWLIFYPLAGQLGARLGVAGAAVWLAGGIALFTLAAARLWPRPDAVILEHTHEAVTHSHEHVHEAHHAHEHDPEHAGVAPGEPHTHIHTHEPVRHAHTFVIDAHHPTWPLAPGR